MTAATDVPLVSVSVITYNHADYIRQTLDSILAQKLDGTMHLVVGDDCSTDGTREIVEAYAAAHPGVVIPVFSGRNMGDAGRPMFLATLEHCHGPFIAPVDGDDFWLAEDKLQRQVDFLREYPECTMCFHDALLVFGDGPVSDEHFLEPGHRRFSTLDDMLVSCCVPGCSTMFRRAVLETLPAWFHDSPSPDNAYVMHAASLGPVGYIDAALGTYRIHSGGSWSGLDDEHRLRTALEAAQALRGPFGRDHGKALNHMTASRHLALARNLASQHRWREAWRETAAAVACDPLLWQPVKLALRSAWRRVRPLRR